MNPLMLQPGRGPGRATPGEEPAAPAPQSETTTKADPPAGEAQPPGGIFGGMGMMLLLPILLFGLVFLMGRSDKKRRAELENKLKKGDKVVTRAGFLGKVVEVGDTNVRVEIAPGVIVRMVKSAIEGLADEAEAAKKDAQKADKGDKDDKDDKKKKA